MIMHATAAEPSIHSFEITKEKEIAAPVEIVFQAILEQLGPHNEAGPDAPMPMKLEAWPGGRWFRDLGNNSGHLWGHVQVIKPPALLEICGPLFMSCPAVNFVQYRLTAEGAGTRLKLVHRAVGLITSEHREGVSKGWEFGLTRIRERAEQKKTAPKAGR
jgi:uncharacterized protein YndB with AHSA1/START domain